MKKQLINLEPIKEQVRTKLIETYNSTIFMNTDVIDVRVDIKEILEEHIKDARPYNITQEGIALAGITEDKNNE